VANKKRVIKLFLKGLVFSIASLFTFLVYWVVFGILSVILSFMGAIGTIVSLLLLIPVLLGGFIVTGWLVEKVNQWVK